MAIQVGLPAEKKAQGPSVAMIYYSTYGHVKQLAEEIKRGIWAFFQECQASWTDCLFPFQGGIYK